MMPKIRQRGFALLLVLSISAVLALIGSQVSASGRAEALLVRNFVNRAAVEFAADGAIRGAIFNLAAPQGSSWMAEGRHSLVVGGISVGIQVEEQDARPDPNRASAAALTTAIAKSGVDGQTAPQVAFAILAYRQRNTGSSVLSAFASIDDLAKVPGLTASIIEHLRPFLAVSAAGLDAVDDGQLKRVSIKAVAESAAGSRAIRRVTVRLTPDDAQRSYQILTWLTPEG